MKKSAVVVAVIATLLLSMSALAVTYDGDINPQDFFDTSKWEAIAERQLNSPVPGKNCFQVLMVNTDINAEIKFVSVVLLQKQGDVYMVLSYTYVKKGVKYYFQLIKSHYRQVWPKPV